MTKILNHINTYADLTAYDNDKDKNYPNIAYIQETNEVKWVKENQNIVEGVVVCKYNVTSTSEATKLLGSSTGITYQSIDDVKQDTVKSTYTFDTLGEHTVKYNLDGTSISDGLFSGCSSLASITIQDNITSIGNNSFGECSSLTSIVIPKSVISIGNDAFNACSSLESIVVDSANTVFDSRDNCNAIIHTSTNKLISGCKNTVIPNTVTSIGDSAYRGCTMTSIVIPNTITSIGNSAFYKCNSLTSVEIPNSVTEIGSSAFGECSSLTSIVIPNSVTLISDFTFYSCSSLTSVTIPNSVTEIGYQAFYSCTGLTSVTIQATTPPTLISEAFYNTNNCRIYVPAESVNAYKNAENWSELAKRIRAIPTV